MHTIRDCVDENINDLALELWYNGDAASWGEALETARLLQPEAQNIRIDWNAEGIRQRWELEAAQ